MKSFLQKFAIQEDSNRPTPREAYGWRIYTVTVCAALAAAMSGYDNAFIGGSLALESFQRAFGINPTNLTELSSNIVSILIAGALIGSIASYFIAEQWGRKAAIVGSAIIGVAGGVIQLFPGHLPLLYAGRAITGIAIGAQNGILPVFLSELAPPTIRGRLVGIKDIIGLCAQVAGYWVNFGVDQHLPSNNTQWRIPVGLQLVIPTLLLVLMPLVVESPRWLVQRKRHEQALNNLSWIRALPADHEYVQWEFQEFQQHAIDHPGFAGGGKKAVVQLWKELVAPGMRGRLIRSVFTKIGAPLTGITTLAIYGPLIFKHIGFEKQKFLLVGIYGVVKVVASILVLFFLIDKIGRRFTLLFGSSILVICQFYLGAYSQISNSFDEAVPKDGPAYFALVAIYIYTAAFACSWCVFPCVFASEIFPTHLRALAMTVTSIVAVIMHFVMAYSIPYMLRNIEYGTFYLFGGFTLICTIFVYLFFPETKAFPLESMDLIFSGSVWARGARERGERLLNERLSTETREPPVSVVEIRAGKTAVAGSGITVK